MDAPRPSGSRGLRDWFRTDRATRPECAFASGVSWWNLTCGGNAHPRRSACARATGARGARDAPACVHAGVATLPRAGVFGDCRRSVSDQTGFAADQYAIVAGWAFLHGRKGTRAVAAATVMNSNFQSGGVWDAKPYLAQRFGYTASNPDREWVPAGDGAKVRADAFGNINYAVMLARYGVTEDVALAASHAPGPDVGYGDPSTYDDAAIRLGYQLASTYPDGFSESTYSAFILENLDSLK